MHLSLAPTLIALSLLSSTTDSFSPRSLVGTGQTSRRLEESESLSSLFVSVSDSIVGDGTLPQKTTVAAVPKVAQRWRKSTKQLATLGPSSSDKEMIEKVSEWRRCLCVVVFFLSSNRERVARWG